ncbi:MAG: cyclopropane-fatty-acyl-phospholipid synthase family protein [Betaproteobacteria bacterium]
MMTSFDNAELRSLDPTLSMPPAGAPPTVRILFALLARLARGELVVTDPDGRAHRFGAGGDGFGRGEVRFRDWRLARDILTGGDVAFAQAWMDGRWDTSDLPGLMTVLAHNQAVLERAFYGHAWQRALFRLKHWLNANSVRRAKRNVVAHYDLGNDFYRLWLDRTMTYSSALFDGDFAQSLETAQQAKYQRILDELALPPGAHILEIGCGWGGFAETAARAGYRVTGLSLSSAQTQFARERIARAGLNDRVTLAIQDYRDERGVYDGVASIEMFEAVGEKYWPAYFATARRALARGGRACVQTITIADERFERYRTQSDFIQQHIFPGGMLSSPSRFTAEARAAGFETANVRPAARDYAETLSRWLAAFDANVGAVREQGFDERFIRCWRFYLAYCIAGFESGSTDVAQYTLVAR